MSGRGRPGSGKGGARRPPLVREFSAGGLVYRRRRQAIEVALAGRRPAGAKDIAWSMPKGLIEPGESARATAEREVREETGLAATIEAPLGEVTYWYARREGEQPVRVFKRVRFFLMRHEGGSFAERDSEMDEVRWFSIEEAEAAATYPAERALIAKAREMLAGPTPPPGTSAEQGEC